MPSRILHPESDWFWLAAEMGWLAIPLVIAATCLLLKRVAPLGHGTDRRLRLAALAAALVFAVHGLADVPGHRLGSVLPGLFVLAMSLNNPVVSSENHRVAAVFRLVALALGIAGAAWLNAAIGQAILPGETGILAMKQHAQELIARKQFSTATAAMTRAAGWGPLDWEVYFLRGTAEAFDGNWPRAFDDFERVNLLESTSPLVTFEEGKVWMNSRPSYAMLPWRETLRRCPPQERGGYYARMLEYAVGNEPLFRLLHALAKERLELELVYLSHATGGELNGGIQSVLQADPELRSLTDAQKLALFRLWAASDDAGMMTRVEGNPGWRKFAWRQIAKYRASHGDLEGACASVFQFMPPPAFPVTTARENIRELNRRLVLHPNDFLAGYELCRALMEQKNDAMAMQVVRDLKMIPGCPGYFFYIEADLAFRLRDFSAAWESLQKYEPITD